MPQSLTLRDAVDALRATATQSKIIFDQFNDFYSLKKADQRALFQAKEANDASQSAGKDALKNFWAQAINTAIQTGQLRPLAGQSGNTVFEESWQALCETGAHVPKNANDQKALDSFSKTIIRRALDPLVEMTTRRILECPENVSNDDLTAQIEATLRDGTFPRQKGTYDFFINHANGANLWVALNSWQPTLWERNHDKQFRRPTKNPDGVGFQKKVSFPTGNVLVADAVNVSGLWDTIRDNVPGNVNYGWDRITFAIITISKFNLVHAPYWDEAPYLVQSPHGGPLFGGGDSDEFSQVANVCHDLWATQLIDEQFVLEYLIQTEGMTPHDAQTTIDDWVKSSQYHSKISLEPGEWTFFWDDDYTSVAAALADANIVCPKKTLFALFPPNSTLPTKKILNWDMT